MATTHSIADVCGHFPQKSPISSCSFVEGDLQGQACTTHIATHCNTLQHTAAHCSTLQHTATHCNTLQRTVTHCNILQYTAICAIRRVSCCSVLHCIVERCGLMQCALGVFATLQTKCSQNESCRICMSHVTHTNASCHTYK